MGAWDQKVYAAGKTSRSYRLGTDAEQGSSVWYGVRAIQLELSDRGFDAGEADGIFGRKTDNAVRGYQAARGLTVDGLFGQNTAKRLFGERASAEQKGQQISHNLVAALIDLESAWDPGAVGTNGMDVGLVQINLDPEKGHGSYITKDQAYDPRYSIPYAAKRMRTAYEAYARDLDIVLWRLATAQHNSPLRARQWKDVLLDTWGDDWITQYVNVTFNRGMNL